MENSVFQQIEAAALPYFPGDDPAHDIHHIKRVLQNALAIQKEEGGDLDIIIPAVFFHDAVKYPKGHPNCRYATKQSAQAAKRELEKIKGYPQEKIAAVQRCIIQHSYTANLRASTLESQIVQDADRLDATGALAIARTFASTALMKKPFYNESDPFCDNRQPEPKEYALDFLFARPLQVGKKMNTATARRMAERRTDEVHRFLHAFGEEIGVPYLHDFAVTAQFVTERIDASPANRHHHPRSVRVNTPAGQAPA